MMDRIAVAVFLELDLRINAAVDILSVSIAQHDRHSPQAIFNALGGELLLQKENVNGLFTQREGKHAFATRDVALQAWAACHAATLKHMAPRYATLSRIATDTMPVAVCNFHHVMHLHLPSDSYDSLYL
jgi:regulator of nonsense transcripts 1